MQLPHLKVKFITVIDEMSDRNALSGILGCDLLKSFKYKGDKIMKSLLEKIYYGELSPCTMPTPTTERYTRARDEAEHLKEMLVGKYPDCERLLEQYTDELHSTAACESLQDFERGFRFGVKIMLEALTQE